MQPVRDTVKEEESECFQCLNIPSLSSSSNLANQFEALYLNCVEFNSGW